MVYPWSNKNDEETSNVEEVDDKQNSEENIVEKGVVVFEAVFALNVRRAKSGDLRLPAL